MAAAKIKLTGTAVLALIGLGIAWYLWRQAKAGVADVQQVFDDAANAVAGAFVPDANAAVQDRNAEIKADLAAAGYPPVGSQAYNDIVAKYDPTLVVNMAGG